MASGTRRPLPCEKRASKYAGYNVSPLVGRRENGLGRVK